MHRRLFVRSSRRAAFTLFEMLIVVALIALLAGLAINNAGKLFDEARKDTARLFVTQSLKTPLMSFKYHVGDFPTTEEGLQSLITPPANGTDRWKGPYVDVTGGKLTLDPWGSPYQYRYPGTKNPNGYDLWSMGPDRKDGTADDIGNW